MESVLARGRGRAAAVAAAAALAAVPFAGPFDWLVGEGYALPPGSAYEKVSSEDKGDGDVWYRFSTLRSSADGTRAIYSTPTGSEDAEGVPLPVEHLATLSSSGWEARSIAPPYSDSAGVLTDLRLGYQWYSTDLARGVVLPGFSQLTPDASGEVRNLFLREFGTPGYALLTPEPTAPVNPLIAFTSAPAVAGASRDLRHVVFESPFQLLPDAIVPGNRRDAYEWADGTLRNVGILPNGTVAPGGAAIGGGAGVSKIAQQRNRGAISEDGSRIVFTTPWRSGGGDTAASGELYLRVNGTTTVPISASQRTVPEEMQPATFLAATPDTSRVFFKSCEKLTDDATAECGVSEDLYMFDVASGDLTDLTAGLDLRVANVVGISNSGDHVYFGATGATTGVYLWHDGTVVSVVGGLQGGDTTANWSFGIGSRSSAVSDDGRLLVFSTDLPLGGANTGGLRQLFLYDAATRGTRCMSCVAPGRTTLGEAVIQPLQSSTAVYRAYDPRTISADGSKVFFETANRLVPEDINGRIDVYQYDTAAGTATLVSSGVGEYDSHVGDASENGDTVFFVTREQLIPDLDRDRLDDLYVARAGAKPYVPPARRDPCVGDACQGDLPAPPHDDVPGTVVFTGPGDVEDDGGSATEPVFSVRPLTGRQRRAWARTGRVRLTVRVSEAGRVRGRVTARLGKKRVVVARASRTARDGGPVALTLRLSAAARKSLKRNGRLTVRIIVTYGPSAGERQAATTTLRTVRGSRGAQNRSGGKR
ncbi:hypothetical protein [Conexibacter arvalis]|uniref:WD40 repeat protein n=1 Tax=Conexibacter arvalis TaxID=912552 RepID=A0A840IBL5_9ACTN|nr:hypothetical protein [Conexibacter arvalis]MBB4661623.1 hypothetical protein [Conexibacter arvalis]